MLPRKKVRAETKHLLKIIGATYQYADKSMEQEDRINMVIAFELTMPGKPSWDERWSGSEKRHIITRSTTSTMSRKMEELDKKSFTYHWDDGWITRIECRIVSAEEAAKLRKLSDGFCGYDWMVQSIWNYGKILDPDDWGK